MSARLSFGTRTPREKGQAGRQIADAGPSLAECATILAAKLVVTEILGAEMRRR